MRLLLLATLALAASTVVDSGDVLPGAAHAPASGATADAAGGAATTCASKPDASIAEHVAALAAQVAALEEQVRYSLAYTLGCGLRVRLVAVPARAPARLGVACSELRNLEAVGSRTHATLCPRPLLPAMRWP